MRCVCGAVVANNESCCPYCRAPLHGQQEPGTNLENHSATMRCPFCAEEVKAEARKCKHCGEFLDSSMNSDQRSRFQYQMNAVRKSPGTTLVLSFFGLSRFYLDEAGLGILQWVLVAIAGVGLVWMIVDVFTARQRTRAYNQKKALEIAGALGISRQTLAREITT